MTTPAAGPTSSLPGLPDSDASAIENGNHANGICASLTFSPRL